MKSIFIIATILVGLAFSTAEAAAHFSLNISPIINPPPVRAYETYIVEHYRPMHGRSRYLRAGAAQEPEVVYLVPHRRLVPVTGPRFVFRPQFFFSWGCR